MDALADILHALRLSTCLISYGRFTAPWSVSTRGTDGTIFHAVLQGSCWVRLEVGRDRVSASDGDVALVPRGAAHVTCNNLNVTPRPITSLDQREREGGGPVRRVEHGGGGDETRIICGSFQLDHVAADQLLDLLPPLVLVPGGEQRSRWLDSTLQLLAEEVSRDQPGGGAVLARLTEVLVVHLLRAYFLAVPEAEAGWLAALRDQQIGRALALIHAEPGTAWTADELAAKVGMSRASFFSRFCAMVGEPPMRYLTRWRMSTAADLIGRQPDLSIPQLAGRLGYRSEEAFSRAFRRALGVSPRAYRAGERLPS